MGMVIANGLILFALVLVVVLGVNGLLLGRALAASDAALRRVNSDYFRERARASAAESRLWEVVKLLEPDGPPIPGGMFDKEHRFYYRYGKHLHERALAIAEGRLGSVDAVDG